jgi:PilZ domain-containing protein
MASPADKLPESDEHPRARRQRVLKGGTIITGISNSEVACTLRNQNDGGAELKTGIEARVPDHFLLYVPVDGVAYRCEVRWRRGDRVGVKFSGTEPKPKNHYG